MKQGGDHRASGGFTIVETLIVLAVTGALFLAAMLLINGRQNKTEFMTAVNSAQQQFQQIVNETQSGYYAGTNFTCQGSKTGGAPNLTAGVNQGCIFLGKVIQLGTDTDAGQLVVYPIVGNQQYTTGGSTQEVDTLAHAYPVAVPGAQTTFELQSGLKIDHASIGAFGVLSSLASYSGCGGNLCSGAQQFSLTGIRSSAVNTSTSNMVNLIGGANAANFDTSTSTVSICLASGTTNQSGLVTIGGSGSLAVSLQIYDGDTTC